VGACSLHTAGQVNSALDLVLDISCLSKRSCIRKCTCPRPVSALECLVVIYLQHRKASSEDEIDPIIRGHISILFGLLMRDSIANQRTILAALPGSTIRAKLIPVVETAQEFVNFYGEVMTRAAGVNSVGTDDDAKNDIPNRTKPQEKGETIARDVVAFLEILSESPDL
jgi:hypothetical protein